jgi:hypothetical protein
MHYYYILPIFIVKYYVYEFIIHPLYNLFAYILSKMSTKKDRDVLLSASNTPTTTSLTEQYIQHQTTRLLKTYDVLQETDTNPNYNENIDAVFYSKSQWTELLKDENNYLEKKWRTKILIENTPRGNIIMYYDAYKLGFAYYSDQTVPYPVLNAVAMKYVLTFFCRDFFMDEIVLPETNLSGITTKHKEDADAEREEKKHAESTNPGKLWRFESNSETSSNTNTKAPFAKFKSYNNVSAKSTNGPNGPNKQPTGGNSAQSTPTLAEPKQTNRFVYLGKTRNVSFLQKPEFVKSKTPLNNVVDSMNSGSGSLSQSGIYSIFSPESTVSEYSFEEKTLESITPPPTQTPKQQLTYAEYKRLQKEQRAK